MGLEWTCVGMYQANLKYLHVEGPSVEQPPKVSLSHPPHRIREPQSEREPGGKESVWKAPSEPHGISKTDRLIRTAELLLLGSLVIPWFYVGASGPEFAPVLSEGVHGPWVFAPAWSAFLLATIGSKFTLHFLNLLIVLSISIVAMAGARKVIKRSPKESSMLLWVAASFNGVALFFFVLYFPRIGYVGDASWPSGSSMCAIPGCETSFQWSIMPGPFIAFFALMVQIWAAYRLMTPYLKPEGSADSSGTKLRRGRGILMRWLSWAIAWTVVAAGVWAGISYSPQLTARSLINEWDYSFKSFKPGDTVVLTDRVLSAYLLQTSYGEFTFVTVGDVTGNAVSVMLNGDQKARYQIGSTVSIPVHIDWYYYNDIPFVWSDVAIAPLPIILAMSEIFEAVSLVAGIEIHAAPNGSSPGRLQFSFNLGLPLDKFNLAINKAAYPYLSESTFLSSEWQPGMVDEMRPIHAGSSKNGTLHFIDANSNGLLDAGDALNLNLPPTRDAYHLDTYVINVFGPLNGVAYIVVGNRGPLLFYLHDSEIPHELVYDLSMLPDVLVGDTCSSNVVVDGMIGQPEPASEFQLELTPENGGETIQVPAAATGYRASNGLTVDYVDSDADGILDEGDYWTIGNLTKFAYHTVHVYWNESGPISNRFSWSCGLGFNRGGWPDVAFSTPIRDPLDPSRFLIEVESVKWVPAGFTYDYSAKLEKNGMQSLPISAPHSYLNISPFGSERNTLPQGPSNDGQGTWLSFSDSNANRFLDVGDYFAVNNTAPGARYELSIFYGYSNILAGAVNWTA